MAHNAGGYAGMHTAYHQSFGGYGGGGGGTTAQVKQEEPAESLITLLQEEITECADKMQRHMERDLGSRRPCDNERELERLWSLPPNEKEKLEIRSLRLIKEKGDMIKLLMTPTNVSDEDDYVLPDLPVLRVVTRPQHEGHGPPMALVPGVPLSHMPLSWPAPPLHTPHYNPNAVPASAGHLVPPPPPPRGPPQEVAATREAKPAVPGMPYAPSVASHPHGLGATAQHYHQGLHPPPQAPPIFAPQMAMPMPARPFPPPAAPQPNALLPNAGAPSPSGLGATARDSSSDMPSESEMLQFVDQLVADPRTDRRHSMRDRHTPERREQARDRGQDSSRDRASLDRPPTDRHAHGSREKETHRSDGRSHHRHEGSRERDAGRRDEGRGRGGEDRGRGPKGELPLGFESELRSAQQHGRKEVVESSGGWSPDPDASPLLVPGRRDERRRSGSTQPARQQEPRGRTRSRSRSPFKPNEKEKGRGRHHDRSRSAERGDRWAEKGGRGGRYPSHSRSPTRRRVSHEKEHQARGGGRWEAERGGPETKKSGGGWSPTLETRVSLPREEKGRSPSPGFKDGRREGRSPVRMPARQERGWSPTPDSRVELSTPNDRRDRGAGRRSRSRDRSHRQRRSESPTVGIYGPSDVGGGMHAERGRSEKRRASHDRDEEEEHKKEEKSHKKRKKEEDHKARKGRNRSPGSSDGSAEPRKDKVVSPRGKVEARGGSQYGRRKEEEEEGWGRGGGGRHYGSREDRASTGRFEKERGNEGGGGAKAKESSGWSDPEDEIEWKPPVPKEGKDDSPGRGRGKGGRR